MFMDKAVGLTYNGVIIDYCLLAVAEDLVEKYISDPNIFKLSKFGANEFIFVLASHAVVPSKWSRNA